MALLPNPDPQFFKLVSKPENASDTDIAKARPVYIDGLPEGGGGGGGSSATDEITVRGIQDDDIEGMLLSDLLTEVLIALGNVADRISALESPGGGPT